MAEFFRDDSGLLLDGMFYDMTFWPAVCRCEHCKELYFKATGKREYPKQDWNDPEWLSFQQLRINQMAEFAHIVTAETKHLMPGVSVEHNYANAVASDSSLSGSTELINDECDYTGGDLYGDLYNHSFTAKYYYNVTKNQPFEYMTCRCDRRLYVHTVTKSEEHLAVEVMLTAAHHGASLIIDAIDPVGTLDGRVYDRVGRVFERQMPYEKYFNGELVQDVGVYYSTTGRYNTRGLPFTNKQCAIAVTRTLIEENVPCGIVANSITGDMSKHRMVFAPHISGLSDKNRADLVRYVGDGGVLYVSGAEDIALLEMLLGARFNGYTEENAVYLAPTDAGLKYFGEFNRDYPFPSELSLPILEIDGADVLATMTMPYTKPTERRFASIHSNPPGIPTDIPALVSKKLGNGTVIWSAAPFERDERRAHKKLLMALLDGFIDRTALSVRTNAPRQVEVVTFRDGDATLVSTVDLLCTDEMLRVNRFTVEVKCDKPSKVTKLGGRDSVDTDLPFEWADGYARFDVNDLVMFEMFSIK
nr:hypothetical protein [Clostridia bacterium]